MYQLSEGAWVQLGADIDGEAASDNSGYSVALSDDGAYLAVGALNNDGNGDQSGHVRVYNYTGGSWVQVGADIDGAAAGDGSGYSVSMSADGQTVAIGSFFHDGGKGHVRVYNYTGGSWVQVGADIDGEAANDYSGSSVSLSDNGTILTVGAFQNDGNGDLSGHTRVYEYSGGSWSQIGSDIDGEAAEDRSGFNVSLSDDGSRFVTGAPFNDDGATNGGQARIYEISTPPSSAADFNAVTGSTIGTVTASAARNISGTAAQVKAALVTDPVALAVASTVTVSDGLTAADASSIASATNATVAFTTGISDTLANLLNDDQTAINGNVTTAAGDDGDIAITISDDSTSITAAKLSLITAATTGTVTLTNAQTITGTGAQVKAALVTDAVTLGAASTATVSDGITAALAAEIAAVGSMYCNLYNRNIRFSCQLIKWWRDCDKWKCNYSSRR